MSEPHALVPTGDIDSNLKEILEKAKHGWLRASEICEVLDNHAKFAKATGPPHKPEGGSLFLFDRSKLRFFRQDGHSWKKRKDGSAGMEAHMKLKVGKVEMLQCYYAHGEFLQRRCYWLLEKERSNIVLVLYQKVEGNRENLNRVEEVVEATPNSDDIEVVPHSEVDTPLSSKVNPYKCQVAPQTTRTASLASSQASEYADAKLARNCPSSSGFHSFLDSQSCSKEKKNGGLSEESQGQGPAITGIKLSEWADFLQGLLLIIMMSTQLQTNTNYKKQREVCLRMKDLAF